MSSSFVSIDWFRLVHGDGSQSVRKHGCSLYVGDLLSFLQVDVDLINFVAVLLDLAVYRPFSNSLLQDEGLVSFISDFLLIQRS